MHTFHSVHLNRKPFVASYQRIVQSIQEPIHYLTSLVTAFEKAKAAASSFARDPRNQEEIRRIVFSD